MSTGRRRFRRIAFAGDPLRFTLGGGRVRSGQDENVKWLQRLLEALPAFHERSLGSFDSADVASQIARGRGRAHARAMAAYQADPESAWAQRYAAPRCDFLLPLFDRIADNDLVVGFELPPTLRQHLQNRGTPYLNLVLHPVRFLRDLALGATTNDAPIQRLLTTLALPDDEVTTQVRRFRALFAKRRPAACAFPSGLPVLVGQTPRDAALIAGSTFADWPDFEEQLAAVLSPFDALVFVEHPQRGPVPRLARWLRQRLGKSVIMTDANGYGFVFGAATPPGLWTLSSSLGVEAQTAGVPAHFMLGDPRTRAQHPGCDLMPMLLVGHSLLQDSAWRVLLGDAEPAPVPARFELGEDFLRGTMEAWSFAALRSGLAGLRSRKTLFSAMPADPQQLRSRCMVMLGSDAQGDEARTTLPPCAAVDLEYLEPIARGPWRTITFARGAGATCLGPGFHDPEAWGVWMSELSCELMLPPSQTAVDEGCILELELPLQMFEPALEHCPVVRAGWPGEQATYALFRPATGPTATLVLRCPAVVALRPLQLCLSRLDSPSAYGMTDTRLLGLALTSARVRCVAAGDGAVQRTDETDARILVTFAEAADAGLVEQELA